MGQVEMQGQLYRSMASRKPRSKFARSAIILVALLMLIIPSIGICYIYINTTYAEARGTTERIFLILPMIILAIVLGAGVRIIYNNLKPKNN